MSFLSFVADRKFSWTRENILLLLEEYRNRIERFRDSKVKKALLWREILEVFRAKGYSPSKETLSKKIRNMKRTYTQIKNTLKKSGRGTVSWEFFEIFSDIMKDD